MNLFCGAYNRLTAELCVLLFLWISIMRQVSAVAVNVPISLVNGTSTKFVIAHFIVGNTFPYTEDDWKRAITLASSKGIDGFALDMGVDSWQPERISDAYKASLGTDFKLFITFDMGSLPCSSPDDATLLRQLLQGYNGHSNQLTYNGKMFVSAFGGQFCRFGTDHMDDGWWNALKSNMSDVNVHFVPAFFMEPPIFPSLRSIDGAFSWDSAWPMSNRAIDSSYDDEYLAYLPGRTYMAGISPWFFTHYSKETYNKNLFYRSDDWLFVARWENLIMYRDIIDFVQVISWNDYGESHYIGPIDGAQPNSEAWTTGFDHQGWLDVTQYYATAFKTGIYPTIQKDRIFLWGRLYPAGADAPDPIGKPLNFDYTSDYVWGLVFLTLPARVDLSCGMHHAAVELPSGASKIKLPLIGAEECSVIAIISRNGAAVLDFRPPEYRFRKNPPTYNYNALVISSPPE